MGSLHKSMVNSSPGFFVKKMEMARLRKLRMEEINRKLSVRRKRKPEGGKVDEDCGPNVMVPDKSEEEMERRKNDLLKDLEEQDKVQIKIQTREQSSGSPKDIHVNSCSIQLRTKLQTSAHHKLQKTG